MYKDYLININYPVLPTTFDNLKISSIPSWEFLNDDYVLWK